MYALGGITKTELVKDLGRDVWIILKGILKNG
jgi:hypothetical protein